MSNRLDPFIKEYRETARDFIKAERELAAHFARPVNAEVEQRFIEHEQQVEIWQANDVVGIAEAKYALMRLRSSRKSNRRKPL